MVNTMEKLIKWGRRMENLVSDRAVRGWHLSWDLKGLGIKSCQYLGRKYFQKEQQVQSPCVRNKEQEVLCGWGAERRGRKCTRKWWAVCGGFVFFPEWDGTMRALSWGGMWPGLGVHRHPLPACGNRRMYGEHGRMLPRCRCPQRRVDWTRAWEQRAVGCFYTDSKWNRQDLPENWVWGAEPRSGVCGPRQIFFCGFPVCRDDLIENMLTKIHGLKWSIVICQGR